MTRSFMLAYVAITHACVCVCIYIYMIKDREIVDVNLSICELLAVSYTRQYRTSLAQSSGCSRYIYCKFGYSYPIKSAQYKIELV